MTSLTPEMIEKAKAVKNAKELLDLAKDNNIEMTEEETEICFAKLNPKSSELSDDALDNVVGGMGIISQGTEPLMQSQQSEGSYAGGIVGYEDEQPTITNCSNSGHIKHDCTGGKI